MVEQGQLGALARGMFGYVLPNIIPAQGEARPGWGGFMVCYKLSYRMYGIEMWRVGEIGISISIRYKYKGGYVSAV